jgi:SAM-dependent methyltransferase
MGEVFRKTWVFVRIGVFLSELGAWVLAFAMTFLGKWRWAAASAALALCADVVGRVWSRVAPVPLPYFMWWLLFLPRGPHSPKNLRRILEPRSGQHILEIGPGIGVHALAIAAALRPDGVLDVLDVQRAMLDRLMARARRRRVTNIVPTEADARKIPYPDHTFDAAYLIGVLGEVPDVRAALRELRRVLKPDGRLIVGELLIDPDFISLPALREQGNDAGFAFMRQSGPRFAYWAIFRPRVTDDALSSLASGAPG